MPNVLPRFTRLSVPATTTTLATTWGQLYCNQKVNGLTTNQRFGWEPALVTSYPPSSRRKTVLLHASPPPAPPALTPTDHTRARTRAHTEMCAAHGSQRAPPSSYRPSAGFVERDRGKKPAPRARTVSHLLSLDPPSVITTTAPTAPNAAAGLLEPSHVPPRKVKPIKVGPEGPFKKTRTGGRGGRQ